MENENMIQGQSIVEIHQEGLETGRPWLSKETIVARVEKIKEIQKLLMKEGIHYGKIPGVKKRSLYKPGSELLLTTFRIARNIHPTDLSMNDEIRYRVEVKGISMETGSYLGSGIGECSSNEEKYKWRSAVCDEEFNETQEDRKRIKYKKDKRGKFYKAKQVRTEPSDLANTILKMASKRGQVDLTLNVLAASEIFTQDLEDVPHEIIENLKDKDDDGPSPPPPPPASRNEKRGPGPSSDSVISDGQSRRLYAIVKGKGISNKDLVDYLQTNYGIGHTSKILNQDYEAICSWAEKGGE